MGTVRALLIVGLASGCQATSGEATTPSDGGHTMDGPSGSSTAIPTTGPDDGGGTTASTTTAGETTGPDGTGVPPGVLECVPASALTKMSEPFSCQAFGPLVAPTAWLPHDCHTQGIGFDPRSGRVVVTCQDEGDGHSGRILSFPGMAGAGPSWTATAALELYVDDTTPHPSAIQIDQDGGFIVAMAKRFPAGPSSLYPLTIAEDGMFGAPGTAIPHPPSHLGAMGWVRSERGGHAVGCGWDCDTLSIYATRSAMAEETLTLVSHGDTDAYVLPGVDETVGTYNSLYLTHRCDDETPLLFASHDDWLDVWEVSGLGTDTPTLVKIIKRQIDESVVKWEGRPIFYEGMTLEVHDGSMWIWAAPHDFGTDACPADTHCSQYAYRCQFGG